MSEGPNELRTVPLSCVLRSVADCDKTIHAQIDSSAARHEAPGKILETPSRASLH